MRLNWEDKMKNLKIGLVFCIFFLFTACNQDIEISIVKTTNEVTIQLGESIDFDDYIYGIDVNDEILDCQIDLNDLDINTIGLYTINCNILDENGDSHSDQLIIRVEDNIAPVISISDAHINTYPINSTIDYLSNISVIDNYDSNVSLTVNTDAVNISTSGLYDVIYTATDSSGNETSETIQYELITLEAPILEIEFIDITSDSFNVVTSISDIDDTFTSITVNVYDGDIFVSGSTKYDYNSNFNFTDLFSERDYRIMVSLEYSLTLGETSLEYTTTRYIETISRPAPEVNLTLNQRGHYFLEVNVTHTALYDNLIGAVIEIYDDGVFIDSLTYIEDGNYRFYQLYANNIYDIKVSYTYDKNDQGIPGTGETSISEWTSFNSAPMLYIIDEVKGMDSYYIDFLINDLYNVMTAGHAILEAEDGTVLVDSIIYDFTEDFTFNFDFTSDDLTASIILDYDLGDGAGPQTVEYQITFQPYQLEIVSISTLYTVVFEGNDLLLNVVVNDPLSILETATFNNFTYPIDSMTLIDENTYQVRILAEYIPPGTQTIRFSQTIEPFEYGGYTYHSVGGNNSITFTVIPSV